MQNSKNLLEKEGILIDVAGNKPLLLHNREHVWVVHSGRVDVFVLRLKDGEAVGARSHLFRAETGHALFGVEANQFAYRIDADTYVDLSNVPVTGLPVPLDVLRISYDGTVYGGGINLADLSRTFSPQQQATEPLIAGLGDTGAGMSVTQNLIESNGGRIWVDAEPGIGTTFSVLFPVPLANKKILANGST